MFNQVEAKQSSKTIFLAFDHKHINGHLQHS